MTQTVGILPLARSTFDIDYAQDTRTLMVEQLHALGTLRLVGAQTPLFSANEARKALQDVFNHPESLDRLLILQLTFTDAVFIVDAARQAVEHKIPLTIWAPTEPRNGGRLRLNALCGLNLASHALSREGILFDWLTLPPADPNLSDELNNLISGQHRQHPLQATPVTPDSPDPTESQRDPSAHHVLTDAHVVQIGEPPEGFTTCQANIEDITNRLHARLSYIPLSDLFAQAQNVSSHRRTALRQWIEQRVCDLATVDEQPLNRSFDLKLAMEDICADHQAHALAIRCWPESFTEYGGAVCGGASLMGDQCLPCACEADVFGAFSQIAMGRIANAPVFLTDLVDIDPHHNSVVLWHCGQAPLSMTTDTPHATVHSNRRMPLLFDFSLKPGRITLMRLSQAFNRLSLVLASGTILQEPQAFSGTCGVLRFDRPASIVLQRIIDSGLEHHTVMAYGDHRKGLHQLALDLNLPLLDLTA